ncbi:EamA family transporter [Polyangium fumosum]|uniref:RarD protein n=1 Tax=Polyangium fumosum TaxID=889272 RepID=A0A4U1IUU7_9BACT|nr:rarD protein [Polyangium fumosum]TKC98177.1 rarD protein [Polyangium fumosum]
MSNLSNQPSSCYGVGVAAGVIANLSLGASSLFWRALAPISPTTLLCYRILVSLITLIVMMCALGKLSGLRARLSRKTIGVHAAAALLVAANWGTFIWASIHGHVVESGLGYLIAPFVAIGVGIVVLKDSLSVVRRSALLLIVGAVLLLLRSGELSHWVYLVIGIGWGGYACLKKVTTLDAFTGLLVETTVLTIVLAVLLPTTSLSLGLPPASLAANITLLMSCGLVSLFPLWLFAHAARRLSLSTMGFFQFVLPSTQLIVALVFYRQPMSSNTLFCFFLIWFALLVIVIETFLSARRQQQLVRAIGGRP